MPMYALPAKTRLVFYNRLIEGFRYSKNIKNCDQLLKAVFFNPIVSLSLSLSIVVVNYGSFPEIKLFSPGLFLPECSYEETIIGLQFCICMAEDELLNQE